MPRNESHIAAVLLILGLSASAVVGCFSREGVVQFDDLTHYLYAHWAWRWPAYLLDAWGRPGFTALYFLPARLGWWPCRLFSAVLTAATAWLAFRIAQRLGLRHAWAVVPLCYAQPLFFQLSLTTLTETALAFYLTLAMCLALHRRWAWSAAVLSVGLLTRHEAIVFLPIWCWYAWRDRSAGRLENPPACSSPSVGSTAGPAASLVSPAAGRAAHGIAATALRLSPVLWAPILVNLVSWAVGMETTISRLFQAKPASIYGHGGPLTYFCRSMEAWGPGVMILAMTGLTTLWRKPRGGAMVAASAVVFFAAQTAVRALGLYESGGYARFLVPISPLVAVAALAGWHRLWADDFREWRMAIVTALGSMVVLWIAMEWQIVLLLQHRDEVAELPRLDLAILAVRIATAVVVILAVVSLVRAGAPFWARFSRAAVPVSALILIVLACGALCHPLWKSTEAGIVDELCGWLKQNGYGGRMIISNHPWIDYVTGQQLPPGRPAVRQRLEQAPVGTLFVWDDQFAGKLDPALPLRVFTSSPSFRLIHQTRPMTYRTEPYLTVLELVRPWSGEP